MDEKDGRNIILNPCDILGRLILVIIQKRSKLFDNVTFISFVAKRMPSPIQVKASINPICKVVSTLFIYPEGAAFVQELINQDRNKPILFEGGLKSVDQILFLLGGKTGIGMDD